MHNLYIALGSNLGDRCDNIQRAIDMLDERVGSVYRVSNMIETEPVGFNSTNRFINGVVLLHTMLSPRRCLEETLHIERELGRTEKSQAGIYHDRTIDLDLLMYDDEHMDQDFEIDGHVHHLTLPHPRMEERDFVMLPLQEIMD